MNKRILLIGLLWDLVLPAVAYYVLRAFGVEAMTALAVGGLAALARVGWVAVIRRRLDGLAALVTASFALLLVVSLLTGDPRALLARESVLSGAAGILLTASCLIRRPVLYAAVRRVNASQAELLARWDERWRTQPAFRRHFFVLSAVIGAVLLAESALRLVLVYTLPVDTVAGLSTGLHVATLAILAACLMWYRERRRRALAAATIPVMEPESEALARQEAGRDHAR